MVALRTKGCQVQNGYGQNINLYGVAVSCLTHSTLYEVDLFNTIIGEQSFLAMRQKWNCNVVRISFKSSRLLNIANTDPQQLTLRYLDRGIELALRNGMYVVLDNHGMGNDGDSPSDVDTRAIAFLMARYDFLDMIMYEIFNEPVSPAASGCDLYFSSNMYTFSTMLTTLRKLPLQKPPILIIGGLISASLWAFLNPQLKDPSGRPWCTKGTVQDLLKSAGNVNLMFSAHPYNMAIDSDYLNIREANVGRSTNIYLDGGDSDLHVPFSSNREYPCKYYNWDLSSFDRISGFLDNYQWILDQDLGPIIFTEFGNLNEVSVRNNSMYIQGILQYVERQNKKKPGCMHFTAWAWIASTPHYQSLLSNPVTSFTPLTTVDKPPLPCPPYPPLLGQQVLDFLTKTGDAV